MGLDFSAIIECPSFLDMDDERICAVEHCTIPVVDRIRALWIESGFALEVISDGGWFNRLGFQDPTSRSSVVTASIHLRTRQGFSLTFGNGAVGIYHPLRWRIFLMEQVWQNAMLAACRAFGELFESSRGVISRDESPVILAFYSGASFQEALQQGQGVEGEVEQLMDLLELPDERTWDSHGYWTFMRNS